MRRPTATLPLLPLALALVLLAGCSRGNVFDLGVGDCFDDDGTEAGGALSDVPIVDCDQPHDNEVFHTFEADGEAFPGDDALTARAEDECITAFEEYVGSDHASSSLEVFPITPTEEGWGAGDREVLCALYDLERNKLEGSMQGTGA